MRRIETLAVDSRSLQSYLRAIAKFPKLTADEERELGRRIQQLADEDALGTLVESNLRFVVSYARRYRRLGVPFLDLIHEGNLGLLEGARRFDPERGEPFIRHAAWWVRQSIMHVLSETAGLTALQLQLEQAPAIRERSGDLEYVDEDLSNTHGRHTTGARVPRLPISEERGDRPGEALGLGAGRIEDELLRATLVQQLESAMTELDPRERQVVRLRYGLHDGEALDVPQIAHRMGISRARVRASESTALQKLRRGKSLRSYLN